MQLLDGIYSTCLPGILSTLGNAEKTVIFCYTFRPAGGACFDLPGSHRHRQVGDEGVSVSPERWETMVLYPFFLGQLNGVQRLAECSDLVELD